MTRFELMIEDHVKQEADNLFAGLGLDTATAIQIFCVRPSHMRAFRSPWLIMNYGAAEFISAS